MSTDETFLDIVSDPICPWCYIGKARLDRALAARPDHGLTLRWRVFQLNPDMPSAGMDRQEYYVSKFGGLDQARDVYDRIEHALTEDGIDFNIPAISRVPNTLNAHRLLRWAQSGGHQHDIAEAMFNAYFRELRDIGDVSELIAIGAAHGMDADLLGQLFASDADIAVLQNEDLLAREMGVTGVPCYILEEKYALVGAQDTETWLKVIDNLSELPEKSSSEA